MKKIVVLFPNDWDRGEFESPKYRGKVEFIYYGQGLFRFPAVLKLLSFDVLEFIDRIVRRFERERVDGILSTDEYIGAVAAAAAAKRLGLPGADPEKLILAQHKFFSRQHQKRIVPWATPDFALVPLNMPNASCLGLDFPFFLKPVKGTYSVFATRVDTPEAARDHVDFSLIERFCLRRLINPFNSLLRAYTDFELDASCFIGEELMEGIQVTVDGFAFGGAVESVGVLDSVMFPGTSTFERFEYPSRLSPAVQERMKRLAEKLIRGMGMNYGQFNVEMFYNESTHEIKIIEINPRLSYQFADLYENVDGCSTYDILLDLTLGRNPHFTYGAGKYKCAASFVLRTFKGKRLTAVPASSQVEKFCARHNDSKIKIYGRAGQSLFPEMRAVGSYRYAVVNTAAPTALELSVIYKDAVEKLDFKFA